jgi:PKD repeat protein
MGLSKTVRGACSVALFMVLGFGGAVPAFANSSFYSAFTTRYPASATATRAGCNTCHGGSTSTFNAYGRDLQAVAGTEAGRIASVEGTDSDREGHSNLAEINVGAQPGWCAVTGCDNNGRTVPSSVPPPLDPAANQPPVARAGGPYTAAVGVPTTLDGSGSTDSDGTIAAYAWNFGNGTSGSGARPSATYTSVGTFTVTLTVTDDRGATNQATSTVTVTANTQPPVADAGGPYAGSVNAAISFDGSASRDPDGSVVSYLWNFGDGGTASGAAPVHVYAAAGSYAVTLTVTDNDGLSDSATTTAQVSDGSGMQPPVADAGGPYSAIVGASIAFDGSGSSDPDGTIVSYDWTFGDGATASGASPAHAYGAAGTYTVALTVTDDTGRRATATTRADITVANLPPVADAGGPYTGAPGLSVAFDGSRSADVDGSIASYAWDFGDGTQGTGIRPTHAYVAPGQYTVTLRVTDDAGALSAATTTSVTVQSSSDGAGLYAANCAACHGDPWNGPAIDASLSGLKRVAGARSCTITGAIFGTSVFPQGVPDMVAFGNRQLTAGQIDSIAGYLNSRAATGEQRYVAACAGCHGDDGRGGRVDEGVRGEGTGSIREAIDEERTMRYLDCLPTSDIESMADFLDGGGNTGDGDSSDDDGGGGGHTDAVILLVLLLLAMARVKASRRSRRVPR